MTVEDTMLADGTWHNVTLTSKFRTLRLILDGVEVGDELDMSIVHDFMDPYLTSVIIGAANKDVYNINTNVFGKRKLLPTTFVSCFHIYLILFKFQNSKDVWPISLSTMRSSP